MASTAILYYHYYLKQYSEIDMSITVGPVGVTGFNVNTESLTFGKTYPTGGALRSFSIYAKEDSVVKIIPKGNITPFLSLSESHFLMAANTSKSINASIDIPENTSQGNYTGVLKIYFFRP